MINTFLWYSLGAYYSVAIGVAVWVLYDSDTLVLPNNRSSNRRKELEMTEIGRV